MKSREPAILVQTGVRKTPTTCVFLFRFKNVTQLSSHWKHPSDDTNAIWKRKGAIRRTTNRKYFLKADNAHSFHYDRNNGTYGAGGGIESRCLLRGRIGKTPSTIGFPKTQVLRWTRRRKSGSRGFAMWCCAARTRWRRSEIYTIKAK